MDNDDVLRSEDVAYVRIAVLQIRRRVLLGTAASSLVATVVIGLAAYYFKFNSVSASIFVASVFLVLGALVVIRWWRHYRSILGQIDIIAERVASGETVYGSKVAIHSYR